MISIRKLLVLGALALTWGLIDVRPASAQSLGSPFAMFLSLSGSPSVLTPTAGSPPPVTGVPPGTPVVPGPTAIFN